MNTYNTTNARLMEYKMAHVNLMLKDLLKMERECIRASNIREENVIRRQAEALCEEIMNALQDVVKTASQVCGHHGMCKWYETREIVKIDIRTR